MCPFTWCGCVPCLIDTHPLGDVVASELPLFAEENDPEEEESGESEETSDDDDSSRAAHAAGRVHDEGDVSGLSTSTPRFCAVCFKELGSLQYQFLANSQSAGPIDPHEPFLTASLPLLSSASECDISGAIVGGAFCSAACHQTAQRHWRLFSKEALQRYKVRVQEATGNEVFSFAAKMIGILLASLDVVEKVPKDTALLEKEETSKTHSMTSALLEKVDQLAFRPYHEVAPFVDGGRSDSDDGEESSSGEEDGSGSDSDGKVPLSEEEFRHKVRSDVAVAHRLLMDILVENSDSAFPWHLKNHRVLTQDYFSRICGALTMNSVGVEFSTHLSGYLETVVGLLKQGRVSNGVFEVLVPHLKNIVYGADEEEHRENVGQHLDFLTLCTDAIDKIDIFKGTALFETISCFNHSCVPNVAVEFAEPYYHATVVALRDIEESEELCITYIDENLPFEQRQHELKEYLFTCDCPKCSMHEVLSCYTLFTTHDISHELNNFS